MFEAWVAQLSAMLDSFIAFTPKVIGALALIIAGLIIGSVLKSLVRKFIFRYRLDERLFREKKPVISIGIILPVIVAWTIYLLFIQAAVDFLGIPVLVNALNAIISWIPRLVEVLIIVCAGYIIAQYVKRQIEKTKLEYSRLLGTALFFLIIYVAIALGLPLVGIDTTLLNNILLVVIGSLGLGFALAIGLGLKDTVAKVAKKYKHKKK